MKMLSFCILILSTLISCSEIKSSLKKKDSAKSSRRLTQVNKNKKGDSLILWATYYYIPTVKHSETGIDLLDENKKSLNIKIDSCDWCKAAIEGTVRVNKNGQVITLNYKTRSDSLQYDCRKCQKYKNYDDYEKTGKILWSKTNGIAKGVKNYRLIPFKSIAVDSSLVPYGSVLFIPEAKNTEYIDGKGKQKKHNGYFFTADTGSKIKGNHIDIFIGAATQNPFDFIKSNPKETFKAFLVKDSTIKNQLSKMHL